MKKIKNLFKGSKTATDTKKTKSDTKKTKSDTKKPATDTKKTKSDTKKSVSDTKKPNNDNNKSVSNTNTIPVTNAEICSNCFQLSPCSINNNLKLCNYCQQTQCSNNKYNTDNNGNRIDNNGNHIDNNGNHIDNNGNLIDNNGNLIDNNVNRISDDNKDNNDGKDNREKSGSTWGQYLNETYFNDIPIINENLWRYDNKKDIEKYKNEEMVKEDKANIDYLEAIKQYEKEIEKLNNEKEHDKDIVQKNYSVDQETAAKAYTNRTKIGLGFLGGIYDLTFNKILGSIFTLFLFLLKVLFFGIPRLIKTFFVEILNGALFVKIIIPLIVIICVFLFIMYLIGFKLNLSGFNTNIQNPLNFNTNVNSNQLTKIAQDKPNYNSSNDSIFNNFINTILTFLPWIKNIYANFKLLFRNINKTMNNYDELNEFSINRDSIVDGRNDNIFNIKLDNYFDNKSDKNINNAYSIFIPSPLEIKFDEHKSKFKDYNELPESIQKNLLNNKNTLKFIWENVDDRFIMKCNNIKDENGDNINNLYNNCSDILKYGNETYDTEKLRLIYEKDKNIDDYIINT